MGHLFKLVLNVHLELDDLVRVVRVVDLLGHFGGFLVHASLEQALCVVEFILDHIRVELGQLIIHIGRAAIILNVEIAIR